MAALLVVVLAHVETGAMTGLRSFSLGGGGTGTALGAGTGNSTLSSRSLTTTTTETFFFTFSTQTSQLYLAPGSSHVTLSNWYLYVLVAAVMATAFGFLLRGGKEGGVYDFAADLERLESERIRMERSWSYRLRNAALVNYYLIVERVGTELGVKEGPDDTPKEYLYRVSQELKVDPQQAHTFAEAFNRARYGAELSETEIAEASRFMGGFVEGLRSRVEVG